MIRQREVEVQLRGKIDPAAVKIIGLIAEDNMMLKQQNIQLAAALSQLAQMMEIHTDILGKVRELQDLRHGMTDVHKSVNASMDDQERAMHALKKGE